MTASRPSLKRNSLARLFADGAGLVFGACGTVITSRVLGPSGQGVFAVLVFVSSATVLLAGLGLGEAAIVRVGQGAASYSEAASATVGALLLSGFVGVFVALALGWAVVQPSSTNLWLAVVATAIDVPVSVSVLGCGSLLNLKERIRASSIVSASLSGTTLVGLLIFVLGIHLSVLGGVLAGVLASDVALLVGLYLLRRGHQSVRPRWNKDFVRAALRFGITLQAVSALTLASNKLDLLFVFRLAGSAAAGRYSVALTAGTVVTMVPYALSMAAFPRVAYVSAGEADALLSRMFRVGLAGAACTAACLAVAMPVAVPAILGDRYAPSVSPAIILVAGGVFLSGQWVLGRAMAARGDTSLLIRSFGLALLVMVTLDLILIPDLGLIGAAASSSVSSATALIYSLNRVRRSSGLRRFLPGLADFREFVEFLRTFLRREAAKEVAK